MGTQFTEFMKYEDIYKINYYVQQVYQISKG